MRILGVDYGTKRIGLAITDENGLIAQPLMSLPNNGDENAAKRIAAIAKARNASLIVVGIPKRTDNRTGIAQERSISFASLLRMVSKLPVEMFDERFTTSIAERTLLEADVPRRRRKHLRDAIAAALILQGYIESKILSKGVSGQLNQQ
ncbi:MAG: Holliday junction resolvase RuvX [Armatimonadota bacterium]|nr:Holliday junction resolvase RuvX [Armatimonadota bacterium]MCX7776804.1 Holliday junction resolvase RuvX [Armatimonadota bacterium]MDW8024600.1 Holliday junction resolvase RuvX [Armatimonadota bacterium]